MPQNQGLLASGTLGVLLMVGLVVGGDLLGSRIRDWRRADRYVEVKGLVERTVKSDSASWGLHFSEAGDSLPEVFAANERDQALVQKFLQEQGFGVGDITLGSISVSDRSLTQSDDTRHGPRFVVSRTITVHSNDVDRVAAANSHAADLIRAGVILSSGNENSSGVVYKFDGLNALKPDMITEATRNARASADRFAADSGSRVGAIKEANQGVFSITAASAGSSTGEADYSAEASADSSLMKKVRVVSTIDYYLGD